MDYTDYIRTYAFRTGRRLYVLQRMLERATAQGDATLVARLQEAVAAERETLRMERTWSAQQGRGSVRAAVLPLDAQVDRLIGGMYRALVDLRDILPASDPQAEMAGEKLATWFPEKAVGYTALPYEDQVAEVGWLLGELFEDEAHTRPVAAVSALGIGSYVRQLAAVFPAYTEAVGREAGAGVTYAAVRGARLAGLDRLARVVARVLGTYDLPADDAVRATLLQPFDEQAARLAAHLKGRRPAPDVDPNTGEDLPEPTPPAA